MPIRERKQTMNHQHITDDCTICTKEKPVGERMQLSVKQRKPLSEMLNNETQGV